jgi:carbamoyl-phosphate synthase/aspartate carbamoyltransferase
MVLRTRDTLSEPMFRSLESSFSRQVSSIRVTRHRSSLLIRSCLGMVGYPESVTDPSYRGQILVITFPLVGNYGVPDRAAQDELLESLPAYFESNQIHIAGLITASYCGEDYSNYLAKSSLGSWLKEQNVPAIYGVDTRALTKKIRKQGSMLGKLMMQKQSVFDSVKGKIANAVSTLVGKEDVTEAWREEFEAIEWVDPNAKNLVAEGKMHDSLPDYHMANR